MRRRDFIEGLAASVAWPLAGGAQQASTAKVGLLWPGAGPPVSPRMESFREGLRRSGYVEGQNVTIELRYPDRTRTTGRPRGRSGTRERRCHCRFRWHQLGPGCQGCYEHTNTSAFTWFTYWRDCKPRDWCKINCAVKA